MKEVAVTVPESKALMSWVHLDLINHNSDEWWYTQRLHSSTVVRHWPCTSMLQYVRRCFPTAGMRFPANTPIDISLQELATSNYHISIDIASLSKLAGTREH